MKQYETVIGLEVHVELATKTKIFCGCSTEFGGAPNTHTCPVCTGMPGSLPVLNKKVVEFAIKAGLAANCHIQQYAFQGGCKGLALLPGPGSSADPHFRCMDRRAAYFHSGAS